jgi:hypothetical protein
MDNGLIGLFLQTVYLADGLGEDSARRPLPGRTAPRATDGYRWIQTCMAFINRFPSSGLSADFQFQNHILSGIEGRDAGLIISAALISCTISSKILTFGKVT